MERHILAQTITVEEEEINLSDVEEAGPPASGEALKPGSLERTIGRTWKTAVLTGSALLVGLAGALLYFGAMDRLAHDKRPPAIKSIAVLPFKIMGATGNEEYLGLGMADTLITALSNTGGINVRPINSVLKYGEKEQDPKEAGRALKVDAVLEGSIQRIGDRIRITARLIRVEDDSSLWAGKFDNNLADILMVQDAISEQLEQALAPMLSSHANMKIRYTESPDAYQLYLKGRYHWNKRSMDGMSRAVRYFRQAIEEDPDFAIAYVGLADALMMISAPDEAMLAIVKALNLDSTLGEAHASLGFIYMFHEWNWKEAEASFKRAIELNPGYAAAHQWYALCLAAEGQIEEAKSEMRQALEIDPLSPNMNADMGQVHYFGREYDEAVAACRKALEIDRDFVFAHKHLVSAYMKKGMYSEAVAEHFAESRSFALSSTYKYDPARETPFKMIFQSSGINGFLRRLIKRSSEAAPRQDAYRIAQYYSLLGEKEQALDWLERACSNRDFNMVFVGADPIFDDLRPSSRYQTVLRRTGLGL